MSPKPILGHFVLFRRWSGGGGGDKEGLWDGRLESEDELVVEGGRKSSSESLPEGEYGIWGESCDDDDDDGEEGGPGGGELGGEEKDEDQGRGDGGGLGGGLGLEGGGGGLGAGTGGGLGGRLGGGLGGRLGGGLGGGDGGRAGLGAVGMNEGRIGSGAGTGGGARGLDGEAEGLKIEKREERAEEKGNFQLEFEGLAGATTLSGLAGGGEDEEDEGEGREFSTGLGGEEKDGLK